MLHDPSTDWRLFLLLSALLSAAGCRQGGDTPSPPSDDTTASTPSSDGGDSAGPLDYAARTDEAAGLLREITSLYQQVRSAADPQPLVNSADRKADELEHLVGTICSTNGPDEATAAQLQAGAMTRLDEAILSGQTVSQAVQQDRDFPYGVATLLASVQNAKLIRKCLLKSITPEDPPSTAESAGESASAAEGLAGANQSDTGTDPSPTEAKMKLGSAGTAASKPEPEELKWQSVVDPAPADLRAAGSASFEITIPGFTSRRGPAPTNGAEQLGLALEQARTAGIVYSRAAGPVVRVGSNQVMANASEVWNLASGKKLGTIRRLTLQQSLVFALSADGAYFATQPTHGEIIGVYDVQAGKPLGGIKIEDWSGLEFTAFGAENRLVIFDGSKLKIFTMPDGNQAYSSDDLGTWSVFEHAVMTPGGRFVGLHQSQSLEYRLTFFDVLSGEVHATLPLDREYDECEGMAISPDGTRLFLLEYGISTTVHTIDLKHGRVESSVDLQLDAAESGTLTTKFYHGPVMDVFPDGARLLLGGLYVVNSKTGELLHTLPEQVSYWVGIVGENQLAVLNGNKLVPWELPAKE